MSGGGLTLDRLCKIYRSRGKAPVLAVDKVDLARRAGRDRRPSGLVGLRQDQHAANDRRLRGCERGRHPRRATGRSMSLPPKDRGVAMAFEGYALYPPLTIRDNIGFALLRERRPRDEVTKRVGEIAGLLEIDDILERYPPTISAGQQQRTSLARALVRRAAITLLDEPMSQLGAAAAGDPASPDQGLSDRAPNDDGVRHPRPDRGDRPCRPDRGHGAGRSAAVRPAGQLEGGADQPVRRELHRRAADERCRGPPWRGARARGLGPGWARRVSGSARGVGRRRALERPREAIASASDRTGSVWASRRDRPPPSSPTSGLVTSSTWRSISAAASWSRSPTAASMRPSAARSR